jgi:hypothetical protein
MYTCELPFLYGLHGFNYSEILPIKQHLFPHFDDLFMTDLQVNLNETLLLRCDAFIIILDAEIEQRPSILVSLRDQLRLPHQLSLYVIESHIITELIRLLHLEVRREDLHLASLKTHDEGEHF